jgi:hypothetical protein
MMQALKDLGSDYLGNRLRDVRLLRSQARAQLGRAHDEMRLARMQGNRARIVVARGTLVSCMANVFTADAMLEALEGR